MPTKNTQGQLSICLILVSTSFSYAVDITLISSDGTDFKLPKEAAKLSKNIKIPLEKTEISYSFK